LPFSSTFLTKTPNNETKFPNNEAKFYWQIRRRLFRQSTVAVWKVKRPQMEARSQTSAKENKMKRPQIAGMCEKQKERRPTGTRGHISLLMQP